MEGAECLVPHGQSDVDFDNGCNDSFILSHCFSHLLLLFDLAMSAECLGPISSAKRHMQKGPIPLEIGRVHNSLCAIVKINI